MKKALQEEDGGCQSKSVDILQFKQKRAKHSKYYTKVEFAHLPTSASL